MIKTIIHKLFSSSIIAPKPRRNSGLTMVEILIAVFVLSISLLGIAKGFMGVSKSLTQSRVKSHAVEFAKGELENYIKLSRLPNLATRERVAWGYWNQVVSDPNPILRNYPDALLSQYDRTTMQSAEDSPNTDKTKFALYRKVTVSTFTSDGTNIDSAVFVSTRAGEYRLVKVELSDSLTPPRFAPVVMETKITRPAAEALDTRASVDTTVLGGTVLDAVSNQPVGPAGKVSIQGLTIANNPANIDSAGNYSISGVPVGLPYTVISYSDSHWPKTETVDVPTHNAGRTTTYSPKLQPVRITTVTIRAVNREQTSQPIEGVSIEVAHFVGGVVQAPPNTSPTPFPTQARGMPPYIDDTDSNGNADLHIPISEPDKTSYPSAVSNPYTGYGFISATKDGYLRNTTFFDVALIAGNRSIGSGLYEVQLQPLHYGQLTVTVRAPNSAPLEGAFITVADNGDELGSPPINGGSLSVPLRYASTNAQGSATIDKIPLNYPSNLRSNTRRVYVRVQRVGYQFKDFTVELKENEPKDERLTLDAHYAEIRMIPPGTAAEPWNLASGGTLRIFAEVSYHGHMPGSRFLSPMSLNPVTYDDSIGPLSVTRRWDWTIRPHIGTVFPSSSLNSTTRHDLTVVGQDAGLVGVDVDAAFNLRVTNAACDSTFQNNASCFGGVAPSGTTPGTVLPALNVVGTVELSINPPVTTVACSVQIQSHPSEMEPNQSLNLTALGFYAGNPAPPNTSYAWSFISQPPGTPQATLSGGQSGSNETMDIATLRAGPGLGSILFKVDAVCGPPSGGTASASSSILVSARRLQASMRLIGNTSTELDATNGDKRTLEVVVTGGSGDYTVRPWAMMTSDGLSTLPLGPSEGTLTPLPTPVNGSQAEYDVGFNTGLIRIVATITDNQIPGEQTTAFIILDRKAFSPK
jgi:type II secretory pathway pseudopilin PulG